MRRQILIGIVAYIGFAGMVALCFAFVGSQEHNRLATEGVRTEATVVAPECWNHGRVQYRFEANGRSYEGSRSPGAGNPPCDKLGYGSRLAVWYDRTDPTTHSVGEPEARRRNDLFADAMLVTLMPPVLIGSALFSSWLQQRRAKAAAKTG